jgi:isopentenyl diphosphate isomerase/L-lactate dehydrogenase-like FMN-dependent dehydrogenase
VQRRWWSRITGGRTLDTAPATCDILSGVVEAVGDRCEIYVDGSSDVLKAIALGARAVLIGRPIPSGLCVAGEEEASNVLEILRRELDETMLFCGCTRLSDNDDWLFKPWMIRGRGRLPRHLQSILAYLRLMARKNALRT